MIAHWLDCYKWSLLQQTNFLAPALFYTLFNLNVNFESFAYDCLSLHCNSKSAWVLHGKMFIL